MQPFLSENFLKIHIIYETNILMKGDTNIWLHENLRNLQTFYF